MTSRFPRTIPLRVSYFACTALVSALALGCRTPSQASESTYVNPHAPDEVGSVRDMYDGALTLTSAVKTFRNIDRLFPTRTVRRGATVVPLPVAPKPMGDFTFQSGAKSFTADDYIRFNRVAGLLVLKDGAVALEHYEFGNGPTTRWMSMSIAKSITSTLIGAALRDGKIRSLDDSVTRYVPALVGSAYDGVTIRQLLTMTSGVRWNETYTDSSSDRRHLLNVQIAQQSGGAVQLMKSLPRAAAPGSVNTYSTGETQVAGEVLRGAIGTSLADYLSEKIWQRVGMDADASWWLDAPNGHEIGGSGLSATLRDYGRFALFVANDGVIGGTRVLPEGWIADASTPKTLSGGRPLNYGYMWWPVNAAASSVHAGAFQAIGIFGQAIYINPREHVIIVQWCAQTKPSGGAAVPQLDFFAGVVAALK